MGRACPPGRKLKNAWKLSKGNEDCLGKTKLTIQLPTEGQRLFSFVLTTTLLEFPAFFKSAGKLLFRLDFLVLFYQEKEQEKEVDKKAL